MKIEHCRSCNAKIVWCKTEKGKAMPLDAEQSTAGMFYLAEKEMIAYYGRGAASVGYTSHFATCPQANRWRKPMKRVIRDRLLTPEEAKKYDKVREQVAKDFPPTERKEL